MSPKVPRGQGSRRRSVVASASALLLFGASSVARAADVTWTRPGNGDWSETTPWAPHPPANGDTVTLPNLGVPYTVTSSGGSAPTGIHFLLRVESANTLHVN